MLTSVMCSPVYVVLQVFIQAVADGLYSVIYVRIGILDTPFFVLYGCAIVYDGHLFFLRSRVGKVDWHLVQMVMDNNIRPVAPNRN